MTSYVINLKQEKHLDTEFVVSRMYGLYNRYSDYCIEQDYVGFVSMSLHLIRNTINIAKVVSKIYFDIGMITWVLGCIKKFTLEEFINGFVDGVYVIGEKLRYTKSGRAVKPFLDDFLSNKNIDDCLEDNFNSEAIEFISLNEMVNDAVFKLSALKTVINTKVLKRDMEDTEGLDEHIFEKLGFSNEKDLEDEFSYGEGRTYIDDYEK